MASYNSAAATQTSSLASTLNKEHTEPTFHFKNIGPVKDAAMELGDLTVIAGRNNTGKTYIAYTLYGFLKSFSGFVSPFIDPTDSLPHAGKMIRPSEQLLDSGQVKVSLDRESIYKERASTIQAMASLFSENMLSDVFSSATDFEGASFDVRLGDWTPTPTRGVDGDIQSNATLSYEYDGSDLAISMDRKGINMPFYEVASRLSALYMRCLLPEMPFNPFVLSAERFGISLFYRELDFTRNNLVDALQKMADDKSRVGSYPLFIDSTTSRYALPIKHNIDYTRSIPDLKDRSGVHENKLYDHIKNMLGGYYNTADGGIRFVSKARREDRKFNIPLHLASTSARGLSDFYFFLRHVAEKGQLLIIDEPESHLDTANQRLMARLLARCVRAGLKILITTHSDYLVKEINNLIMLDSDFRGKQEVAKRLGYEQHDSISSTSIRAYVAEGDGLTRCQVDKFGIGMPVFDDTIDQINRVSNELAVRLQDNES